MLSLRKSTSPPSLETCADPLTPATGKPLHGVRYACRSEDPICADFDLCFKCIEHQSDIHPADHKFEKAEPY